MKTVEPVWQVVEYAGTDRQTVVYETNTYESASRWCQRYKHSGEYEELGVDILKDGSTEY